MKRFLSVLLLSLLLVSLLSLTAFATEQKEAGTSTCENCEVCNPDKAEVKNTKEMEFKIDTDAFVDSLSLMGKGMVGIFVVTLVIIGVVATLNWHGKSLEERNNKSNQ